MKAGIFFFARLFKVRVKNLCLFFFFFFDPWFTLLKFVSSDTEYAVGWLPLGGVKIAGMIDESMDTLLNNCGSSVPNRRGNRLLIMGGWRTPLPVGPVHLLMISICVGRPIYKGAGRALGMGFLNETAKSVGFQGR